jgi:hypothetical protein
VVKVKPGVSRTTMSGSTERGEAAGPGISGSGESKSKRDELRRTESGVSGVAARDRGRGEEHEGTTEPGATEGRRFGGGGVSSSTRMGDEENGRRFRAAWDEENAEGREGVAAGAMARERERRAAVSSSSSRSTTGMWAAETREAMVGARVLSPGASSIDLGNGEWGI